MGIPLIRRALMFFFLIPRPQDTLDSPRGSHDLIRHAALLNAILA